MTHSETRTEAFIDGIWYTISRNQMTYNSEGKRITSENLAGQITTTAWGHLDCTPVGELISAAKNAKSAEIAHDFDDIGNRETSFGRGTNHTYTANSLNQYTCISNFASSAFFAADFTPQFDGDGNQTLIKTATGIWQVQYNGENRPVVLSKSLWRSA